MGTLVSSAEVWDARSVITRPTGAPASGKRPSPIGKSSGLVTYTALAEWRDRLAGSRGTGKAEAEGDAEIARDESAATFKAQR